MNRIVKVFMRVIPYLRKISHLQQEEEELKPKVEAGIKKVMANGDVDKKEKITDKVKTELRKCGEPV